MTLLLCSVLCYGQTTPAQVAKNQTFTTNFYDYNSMDFNPANLAANRREGKKVSFGLLQLNMLMFNRELKRDLLHDGSMEYLSDPGHWFDDILIERTHIAMENTWLGLNFNTKKAGSFGINLKTHIQADAELNGAFEDLDFEGSSFSNLPDIIMNTIEESSGNIPAGDVSTVRMNVVNEIGTAYSRQIVNTKKVQLFGGVGVKYLMGFADVNVQFNNHQVAGYYSLSSMLPDEFAGDSTSADMQHNKKFSHGFGTSFGTQLRFQKLRAGVSVVDVGFIKWPTQDIFFTKEDVIGEVITEGEIDQAIDNVLKDSRRDADGKERLPVKMIIGTSYDVHKYVAFYLDVIAPLNESQRNMTRPTVGVGTWLSAMNIVTLKVGATLTDKKLVTVPMYLSLFSGKNQNFEMSFGTSDFVSFFKQNRGYMNMEAAIMKYHF